MTETDLADRLRALLAAPAFVIAMALLLDSCARAWHHLRRLRAVQRRAAVVRNRARASTPLRIVR